MRSPWLECACCLRWGWGGGEPKEYDAGSCGAPQAGRYALDLGANIHICLT